MKMNRDKPCHNSFCEPAATERRSKKTHKCVVPLRAASVGDGADRISVAARVYGVPGYSVCGTDV